MDILEEKLSPELYSQVKESLGDVKLIVNDGNYIPKVRLNEEIDKKKALQSQVDTLSSTLGELKGKVKSVEELESALSKTDEALKTAKSTYETELANVAKNYKFELELSKLQPKNLKAVKALFDMDKISADGDNLLGFSEQAQAIKDENPFLFGEAKKDIPSGDDGGGAYVGKNPFASGSINFTEQVELKKNKPALYEKLKKEAGK